MVHIAGFRGAYRDAALRESVQPPEVHPPVDSDEADPRPAAEDEEFFQAPDAQSKEVAINKFLDGIEGQECSGFKDIHRFLNHLPVLNTNDPSHVQQAQGFGLSVWLR